MSKIQQRTKSITGDWVLEDNLSLNPKSPLSVLLGVTSSIVIVENKIRKGLILINGSANTISIGLGVDAVLNKGITLYPGGVFNMAAEDFWSGQVNGIAAGVDSLLSIQEFS
jgi:hypothetical protein